MKVAFVFAAALTLCVSLLGPIQARFEKPKYCVGENGKHYLRGEHYDDKVKGTCIRYTCVRKGKKLKMSKKKVACAVESEADLVSNVTAIEASVKFLNGSMESMENKMEALQSNVESLQSSVESLQISVESILGMITAMQSTSSKLEANVTTNIDDIKTNKDDISANVASLATKCDASSCASLKTTATDIETKVDKNAAEIATKCDSSTCSAIQNTTNELENCLEDISSTDCPSSKDGMTSIPDAIKANTKALSKLQMREFLVITSGLTGNHGNHEYPLEVEIITEDGVCNHSIPNFPVKLYYPESAYMESKYLMTCGNDVDTVFTTLEEWKGRCYTLDQHGANWVELNSTIKGRHTFTMTKVGQELFAFGAHNHHKQENIEKYSNGKWEELSSPLLRTRQEHCTVLYKNTLLSIGGYGYTTAIEQLDLTSMTVSSNTLPNFPINKLHRHACIVVQEDGEDVIYVTGGFLGHPDNGQKKVWKYNGGDKWELDGEMNVNRYHHTMGALGGKLVVVGGSTDHNPTGSIEIREKNGKWRELATGLSTPRFMHAMSLVPSTYWDIFSCTS